VLLGSGQSEFSTSGSTATLFYEPAYSGVSFCPPEDERKARADDSLQGFLTGNGVQAPAGL
jgi:hypothetical protein